MLTQIVNAVTTSTTTVLANKQIIVAALSSGAVMYEVPAGRKFVGVLSSTGNYQANINNVAVLSTASAVPPYLPIELVAGSKVTSGQSYSSWCLIGVETNA